MCPSFGNPPLTLCGHVARHAHPIHEHVPYCRCLGVVGTLGPWSGVGQRVTLRGRGSTTPTRGQRSLSASTSGLSPRRLPRTRPQSICSSRPTVDINMTRHVAIVEAKGNTAWGLGKVISLPFLLPLASSDRAVRSCPPPHPPTQTDHVGRAAGPPRSRGRDAAYRRAGR